MADNAKILDNANVAEIDSSGNVLDTVLVVPVNKLDADQYGAEDIDGITESIFGSGNMNFLSLQASQTNEAIAITDPFSLGSPDDASPNISNYNASAFPRFGDNPGKTESAESTNDRENLLNQGDGLSAGEERSPGEGNFSNSTVSSVSVSTLSSDSGAFSSQSRFGAHASNDGIDGSDGNDDQSATAANGRDGINGNDGNSGNDGNDGDNGHGNGNDTDTGIDIDINIGDININLGNTVSIIDEVLNEVGDTITNLTASVSNVTVILGDVIGNITDLDITNISEITEAVNNITSDLTTEVADFLTEIINSTTNITNLLDQTLGGHGSLGIIAQLLNAAQSDLVEPLPGTISNLLSGNLDLNPVVNFVNSIADITGLDVLSDALSALSGETQNLESTIGDLITSIIDLDSSTDLVDSLNGLNGIVSTLTGSIDDAVGGILSEIGISGDDSFIPDLGLNPVLDLASDTVEGILGNIDTGIVDTILGVGGEEITLGDAGIDLTPVSDLISNIGDTLNGDDSIIDLLGLGGDSSGNNDTDLGGILGPGSMDGELDSVLNPVEDLVGDIDTDIGIGADLLSGGQADGTEGDTDINIGVDLDIVDNDILGIYESISIDPVESIIGDTDIDVTISSDLLGQAADELIDSGDGGTGDNSLLSSIGDTLSGIVDDIIQPVAENTDINVSDDMSLDQVESIVNGIGIDVSDAINLLDQSSSSESGIDSVTEGLDEWTENISAGDGGLFGDLVDGLSGVGDILPDPVGTVAEGISALNIEHEPIISKLGGLFGH